jgi:hypothetical protein
VPRPAVQRGALFLWLKNGNVKKNRQPDSTTLRIIFKSSVNQLATRRLAARYKFMHWPEDFSHMNRIHRMDENYEPDNGSSHSPLAQSQHTVAR